MEIDAKLEAFASTDDDGAPSQNGHLPVGAMGVDVGKHVFKQVGNSLVTSAAPPSPIYLQIDETPAVGRMWYVKKFAVFGTDGHTAVSGAIVDGYAGPSQEMQGVYGAPISAFPYQIITGASVPFITRYGHEDQPLHAHEHLYVWIYSAPATQAFELVAEVDEYWIDEIESTRIKP
jgi:hypothetical protein